jgi:hypothetical protein
LKSFFCPLLLSVSLSLFLSRLNSFARISCIWKYCLKENIICRKLPLFRFRNCKKKTKNVKTIANRQNYLGGKMFNQTSTILIGNFSIFYCKFLLSFFKLFKWFLGSNRSNHQNSVYEIQT